jgi:hypothetical protein
MHVTQQGLDHVSSAGMAAPLPVAAVSTRAAEIHVVDTMTFPLLQLHTAEVVFFAISDNPTTGAGTHWWAAGAAAALLPGCTCLLPVYVSPGAPDAGTATCMAAHASVL